MPGLDERLDLARLRDLRGRQSHPWIRRGLLAILGLAPLLALAGAIGQPTRAHVTTGAAARLRVEVPDVLRGGLMWRARVVIQATGAIRYPRILLGPGFVRGNQVNTIEPSPQSEASRGARVVLSYPGLKPGDELVVYLQFQVDPTTVGRQDTTIELDDGTVPLARIRHTTTVLP